jgi:hypothetical protein
MCKMFKGLWAALKKCDACACFLIAVLLLFSLMLLGFGVEPLKEFFENSTGERGWIYKYQTLLASLSGFFSALLGAYLAFYLAIRLYQKKKWDENITYLRYVLVNLISMQENLLCLMDQQLNCKHKEALSYLNGEMDSAPTSLFKLMGALEFKNNIDLDRLSFIASHGYDFNYLKLLNSACDHYVFVGNLIDECNQAIKVFINSNKGRDIDIKSEDNLVLVLMVATSVNALNEVVQDSLYLTKKSFDVITKDAKKHFSDELGDLSYEIAEKYKIIEIRKIDSYERETWFNN